MKNAITFLFFCAFLAAGVMTCQAQSGFFFLSGHIRDCKSKEPLSKMSIKLDGSDGSTIYLEADSNGYYSFDERYLKVNTGYLISVISNNKDYAISSGRASIFLCDTSDHRIQKDFCFGKNTRCVGSFPNLTFKKNSSIDFYNNDSLDDPISWVAFMLEDNPNLVVEIGGHSGKDESKPQQLSELRAECVKSALVKKGINPLRLTLKAYGDKIPSETSDLKEEFDRTQARRITIKIIRTDFLKGP
jgi:outer membrane protein OmpA-like peptidoglycan-associated protein